PGGPATGLAGRGRPGRSAAFRADWATAADPTGVRAGRGCRAVAGVDRDAGDAPARPGLPGTGNRFARRRTGGGVAAERPGSDGAVVGGGRAGTPRRTADGCRSGDLRRRARNGG